MGTEIVEAMGGCPVYGMGPNHHSYKYEKEMCHLPILLSRNTTISIINARTFMLYP